jgi:hypothetical protein
MSDTRLLRVFLCHASQDKSSVRELNKRLKSEEWLDPWLDEEKLSLGQHWTTVIEDALDAADVVIIFLSNNSIKKEGFVQRELDYAWKISLEKPQDVIFLIPFRLDDCEVPRNLRARQWGDYFGENKKRTYTALLRSLKERHNQISRLEAEKRTNYDKKTDEQILLNLNEEPPQKSFLTVEKKEPMLSDFRLRQRDYLLEVVRAITQELDLDKVVRRVLRISIEMLAGQAGIMFLKELNRWHIAGAHGVPQAFLDYLTPLIMEEKVCELDNDEFTRMLKDLAYTASQGLLNGTGIHLIIDEQTTGNIFIFRTYPDLFSANDRSLLQAFSSQTAIAIRNALLYKAAITTKKIGKTA